MARKTADEQPTNPTTPTDPAQPAAPAAKAAAPKEGAQVLVHYLGAPGPQELAAVGIVTTVHKDSHLDVTVPKTVRRPRELKFERVRPGPGKLVAGPYWLPAPAAKADQEEE